MIHSYKNSLFFILLLAAFTPWISASIALAMGAILSLTLGNPYSEKTSSWSKTLLQVSVVGLGFGIEANKVLQAGWQSLPYTVCTIFLALLIGILLGKALGINSNISKLISFGTAICGGSAIAALAPVIKAREEEIAVSLAIVFTLNAIALFIFPIIGHSLGLNQELFGLWAALGIHDTSSVVGASSSYGAIALERGVTVKLTRALWIVPLVLIFSLFEKSESKIKVPLFIVGFIAASILRSTFIEYQEYWNLIYSVSRQLLVVTLFLIGSSISREIIQRIGLRPLAQAIILWLIVSCSTLAAIVSGIITP
ncbi:UNVERIFIED_CONTAM: hypothetical protein GTU68_048904 [Idotea baltica]|nr:hypothetical protein [Idotea baltica]